MKLFKIMGTAFAEFDTTVQAYLAKTFNALGIQYTQTQIFNIIFNGIKGIMQNAMFYIEDAFTEQNIETAVRKQSVYSLAKQSGFIPSYGYTATGTLIGKVVQNTAFQTPSTKLYIPNYTYVQNSITGMRYLIILPTDNYVFDISKPLLSHEFKIIQGTYNVSKSVAKGSNFETVSISAQGYWDKGYTTVKVDGVSYTEVANIYDMTENGKEYVLTIGYDNTFDVMFGNGIYGSVLNEGANIEIQYITHSGSEGNVLSSDENSFVFTSSGSDSYGNTLNLNNYMLLSMNNCISGGTDSDDIELVRNMIGYNSRSLVLASEDNYKLFFSRFSFIGHIKCWSEENSMNICVSCLSNKFNELTEPEEYFKIDPSELLLTTSQKELISTALDNSKKAFAGITLNFKDPVIRLFSMICYVKVKTTYGIDTVKTNISNAIAAYFTQLDTNTQYIAKSTIITYILENVDNIDALDIDFISDTAEQCYKDGYYWKYGIKYINGIYEYTKTKVIYEEGTTPGLDAVGNISLDSKLEIPFIHGGFNYYPNKVITSTQRQTNYVKTDAIQFIFI